LGNPKEEEFFRRLQEIPFKHARIAAFGSTRRANNKVEEDTGIRALLACDVQVVTIVGKTWGYACDGCAAVFAEENLVLCADSAAYLKNRGGGDL
jgi:2-isopropylmalate synthase